MSGARWLRGTGDSDYLQFAYARITRTKSPLGGYHYRTARKSSDAVPLYSGNSYMDAFAAAVAANPTATGQQGGAA